MDVVVGNGVVAGNGVESGGAVRSADGDGAPVPDGAADLVADGPGELIHDGATDSVAADDPGAGDDEVAQAAISTTDRVSDAMDRINQGASAKVGRASRERVTDDQARPLARSGCDCREQPLECRPAPGRRTSAYRAGVTQLAECLLPKQNVAGSNPVSRSKPPN